MDEKSTQKLVGNFYDKSFLITKNKLVSSVLLILYFPFGLALLTTRFACLLVLYVFYNTFPTLNTNPQLISLVSFFLGIYPKTDQNPTQFQHSKNIFVSNHITCFDYIAVKTLLNNVFLLDTKDYINSENFFLTNLLKSKLNPKKIDGFNNQFLYFPEQLTTNGRFELLKFDLEPIKDSKLEVKPLGITCYRPFLLSTSFSVNLIESNEFINVILFLFSPVTVFKIDFSLDTIERKDGENLGEVSERVRLSIASKLGLKLSSTRAIEFKVDKSVQNLASQIQEIFPDVSIVTIQQHIESSPTLDIDTVIASILDSDSESSLLRTQSSPVPKPVLQTPKSNVFETKKVIKYKSYEEQKFELLNEARKRFLAREYNQAHKPEFF